MKELNLSHYRFSISWSRILPDGININNKGIKHYSNIIDALLEANIEPFITLYHWDLPQSIYDITNGGWINSSIIGYFERYSNVIFDNFNDRVKYWLTFNEPWTFCFLGYDLGIHAPGRCTNCKPDYLNGNSSIEQYKCAHNVLLSHSAAVKLFRNKSYDGKIGITLNIDWAEPASSSKQDYDASQRRLIWALSWFADPIYFGDYPQIMKNYIGDRLPSFTLQQKKDLNGSHDFFGLNHYTTKWIKSQSKYNGSSPNWSTDQRNYDSACNQYNNTPIGIKADSDWLWYVPWGIYNIIKWIDNRYNYPDIYITENGCDVPNEDLLSFDDIINDTFRIRFYDGYITSITKAINNGSNIKGYFAWSLLDNFEWADGYSKRFGLHYVNYTQKNLTRYPKNSAKWFSNYVNILNPNATYIGPTLSPITINDDYAQMVCPTLQTTTTTTTTTTNTTTTNNNDDNKNKGSPWLDTLEITTIVIVILIVVFIGAIVSYKCLIKRKIGKTTVDYQNLNNNDQL